MDLKSLKLRTNFLSLVRINRHIQQVRLKKKLVAL